MKSDNEKVLYSDGSLVTVTESMLQVRKTGYDLKGITRYGLNILQPMRLPWLVVLTLGIGLVVAGIFQAVPTPWVEERYLDDILLTGDLLAILSGIALIMAAIGVLLSLSERYAVSITTAQGDQNVVVSRRKEYVTCIVNALNSAFFARIKSHGEVKTRQFTVSGR